MSLFEYCKAIFLVMPGKPSFRRLDLMSVHGIGRALLEKKCQDASQDYKHLDVNFKITAPLKEP